MRMGKKAKNKSTSKNMPSRKETPSSDFDPKKIKK